MGNDYVNAMFESLQSSKSRLDCSELFSPVIKKLSFNCFYIVNLNFMSLIVGVVWPLITERCPINYCCGFANFSALVQLSFHG